MQLRSKLIVLQISVVSVLTGIIAALVISLLGSAIPLMERGVATKTIACLDALTPDADLGLAAKHHETLQGMLRRCRYSGARDVDQRFLAVIDAQGKLLAHDGHVPAGLKADPTLRKRRLTTLPDGFRAEAPVVLEGIYLGTLFAEFSTERIVEWERYYLALSFAALLLVLVSGLLSVFFAVHLIQPLRKMIDHVHQVAAGNLDGQLSTHATDELGQLSEDLGTMTVKLRESRQLITDASRHAGMAEVASNVLHNVGNVLNSVNVSCEVISGTLRDSKRGRVAKVGQMLAERAGDRAELARFLAEDDRGRNLPRYVTALGEQLQREQLSLLEEVASLRKNVEHIKVVIGTQQQYSRAEGIAEDGRHEEVAETALQMITGAADRQRIQIVRDYENLPTARVERHKLLQVLVNLLNNAQQAVNEANREDRQIAVQIRRRGERVQIAVEDNGVGIPPENLAKVFRHGFSTKEDGNGFGLHASANNAKEMGGSLIAESPGAGQGSRFVLDLPLERAVEPTEEAEEDKRPRTMRMRIMGG